jgi:hypothetical protein
MTTGRLEQLAHRVGVECGIKVAEAQEDGRYFVTDLDGEPLKQPVPLGFTDEQAAYEIASRRWERYVLRGAPTRLTNR